MAWSSLHYFKPYPIHSDYSPPFLFDKIHADFCLTGAYAVKQYIPNRTTEALDVYVHYIDLDKTYKQLLNHSIESDYYSDTHKYLILKKEHLYLNIIGLESDWALDLLKSAQANIDLNSAEPIIQYEWLIISKLLNGTVKDYIDCAQLLSISSEKSLRNINHLISKWSLDISYELQLLTKLSKSPFLQKNQQTSIYHQIFSDWQHLAIQCQTYSTQSLEEIMTDNHLGLTTPSEWPKKYIENNI